MPIKFLPRFIRQHRFDRKLFLIVLFSSLFIQAALGASAILLIGIEPKPHFPNHMAAQILGYFVFVVLLAPSNLFYLLWRQMLNFPHMHKIADLVNTFPYLWVALGFLLNILFQYLLIHYIRQRRRRRNIAPPIQLPE